MGLASVLLVLAILMAWHLHARRQARWTPLLQRRCQGRAWREAFPAATAPEIRRLLALVGNAFCIAPRHRLCLHPADKVLQLYRLNNPCNEAPDAMELEVLRRDILQQHGVDLHPLWHADITLGELLQSIRLAQEATA